ncbi:MAG: hypothetical protein LBP53_02080 [Candidatus Peribacteria bacterium]|jgi:hypothetical protein|nr:hypothetical protein [Candidatus Peribacteria bacterium]
MKKLFLVLAASCIISTAFAYTPTTTDTEKLTSLKNVLTTVSNADLWNYYQQFATLGKAVVSYDEQLDYFLTHLRDFAYSQFSIQKNLAKQQSIPTKSGFLATYLPNISLYESLPSNCI